MNKKVDLTSLSEKKLNTTMKKALALAKQNQDGKVASYIPELASIDPDLTGVCVQLIDGRRVTVGGIEKEKFTLQSAAKLIVLIGMLEEHGPEQVYSWVKVEPSGDDFASVARLDQFGPRPSNPMLNSGAIVLCSHIPGNAEQRLTWLETWTEKLFGTKLSINQKVFASERRTGDRNRSIAYLLKSNKMIAGDVDDILETYFYLCSIEANVIHAANLPCLLANLGRDTQGNQIIKETTARDVTAIMATCGLYNESGSHLVLTGMPAKSGVSGFILSVAPHIGGIAAYSPRVNAKGTSYRGEIMLQHLSQTFGWHFAG